MSKFGQHRDKSSGLRRLKRPLLIAFAFLGFFVLSNYYMGFLNSSTKTLPTDFVEKVFPESERILPSSSLSSSDTAKKPEGNKKTDVDKPSRTRPDPKTQSKFNPPPIEEDNFDKKSAATCKHTRDRDYDKDPIVISGRFSGRTECDVPCTGDGTPDASAGSRGQSCPHIKSIYFTMENSIPPQGAYDIVANTQLTSDVPLPYFSWAEYKFKTPVNKKTAPSHIAAFISNCGPQRRLEWMRVMMQHGVRIDSYGNCMKNKEVPQEYHQKYGSDYNALKMALISTYKFTMSFENSATDDYVTEKLFGVLVSGSVPLYDGASNGKDFGPSAKSMIFAEDYGTPEKLAEHLLYLDSNDTAYEEYLQWKKTGPTDEWVALVDMANVHSNCRLCIRTADLHRKEFGPVKTGQPEGEDKPDGLYLELHVRERGKFWLRNIYLTAFSIEQLKEKINTYVPHTKGSYLFSIHELWSRKAIETDADVTALGQKTELEAIFVVPERWEDLKLMW